jgi:hypothetical protein
MLPILHPAARILGAALIALGVGASAPDTAQPRATLDQLAFMSGCWRGSFGNGGTIEEVYTSPSANLMLGATRYLRDGRAVDFEFTMITAGDSGIAIIPHPKGVRSVRFPLEELDGSRAVWENLSHDFPKRIIYRREGAGELIARIEGDGRAMEWRMRPMDCATGK